MRRSAARGLLPLALLASAGAFAQSRDATARCREACARYVPDVRGQATACAPCLTHPGEPAAWMEPLKAPPPGARKDADWAVRWGALRLEARGTPKSAQRRLAAWVASSTGADRELACLTAVHVSGALGQRVGDFLAPANTGEPAAAGACAVLEAKLLESLEPSLFAVDPVERREVVRHLSKALGRTPAQVLLAAMKTRPPAFDEVVADELIALAQSGEEPAGRALLTAATPATQGEVNRLLAIFSRRRDELRPRLSHPALEERRAAVSQLAALAPLSAPDLAPCLDDASSAIRLAAAKGLARGEGRTLAEAAEARLTGAEAVAVPQRLAWLELLSDASAPGCADVALRAWEQLDAPVRVRGAALSTAAACDWAQARAAVETAAASKDPGERAAAAWAAARGPTTPRTIALSTEALASNDAEVVAAGLSGVARHRQKALAPRAVALTAHQAAQVRAEALRALATLDPGQCRAKAVAALDRDESAEVRKAAALALAGVGGPQAVGALDRAARNDTDPSVKLAAADSLRKLGAGSPTP
ncbi:MAG: HEAT repeat domain-containing protein [Myxococcota bacterium]